MWEESPAGCMFQMLPALQDSELQLPSVDTQPTALSDTVDAQVAFCDLLQYLRRAAEAQRGLWHRVVVSTLRLVAASRFA